MIENKNKNKNSVNLIKLQQIETQAWLGDKKTGTRRFYLGGRIFMSSIFVYRVRGIG